MSPTRAELGELAGRAYAYGIHTRLDTDGAPQRLRDEVIP